MRVWTIAIVIMCLFLVACQVEELRTDVNLEVCASEKKVPLNCLSINVDDIRNEFTIIIDQYDSVELEKTDFIFFDEHNCDVKKLTTTYGKYKAIVECEDSIYNQALNGTFKINYKDFKGNTQVFEGKYIRTFGKKKMKYDRSIFETGSEDETPWYER